MITKEIILKLAEKKGKLYSKDLVQQFDVSRQYVNHLITTLVLEHKLIKIGSTRKAFYIHPEYAKIHQELLPIKYIKSFRNSGIEEHIILDHVERAFPNLKDLPENVQSIFTYAFSEMLNNAIEHSKSVRIGVEVSIPNKILSFIIEDSGIGVFRNVMKQRGLKSELEAIQDVLKGKTTTMPKSHSGEGIFFTSKAGDIFTLESFGYQLMIDNNIPDIFIGSVKKIKRGTRVTFNISTSSDRHLNDVFMKYTNLTGKDDYGFDKTEITVKLYTIGGIHISRSQARRILAGLDKFKIIVFDFDKVPTVGQAFADEIFRVFHNHNPQIKLVPENMNEGVEFMIRRAINEAKLSDR